MRGRHVEHAAAAQRGADLGAREAPQYEAVAGQRHGGLALHVNASEAHFAWFEVLAADGRHMDAVLCGSDEEACRGRTLAARRRGQPVQFHVEGLGERNAAR